MRKFFYAAVLGLVAIAASSETASARTTPWSWHHGVPVYSGRHHVDHGGGYAYSGRRFGFSRRWRFARTTSSTGHKWHHGVPISDR